MKTILALLIGFSLAASAQPRHGAVILGEARVDGGVDHDRIVVTAARGEYRAIRLRVENAPVRFDRVVVHYGNGSSEPISVRHRIQPGDETRAIDLPGARRVIESVEFWYERADWTNGSYRSDWAAWADGSKWQSRLDWTAGTYRRGWRHRNDRAANVLPRPMDAGVDLCHR